MKHSVVKRYDLLAVGLFAIAFLVGGCSTATTLKNLSPIQPPAKLPEQVLVDDTNPNMFKTPAKEPILSSTQEGVRVDISYWRRADLDRQFNRGNAVSPFYETEAMHQGEKTDVFYVKITNNAPQKVTFDVRKCFVVDQGENLYGGMEYDDLEERLKYSGKVGGLYVKNGLDIAKQILLEKQIGNPEDGIPSGGSIEGFLPFRQLKMNAETLEVVLPMEIAPPENTAQRPKRLEFRFPYTHDRGIRVAQPAPLRY